MPGSLKDLEEQAAGNADDSLNPGDKDYKNSVASPEQKEKSFDETLNDNNYSKNRSDTKVDSHGDTIQRNEKADPKQDRESLDNSEKQGDSSLFNGSGAHSAPVGGLRGKLQKGFRKGGPTGGVIGILLFGIIGLGGGSSFIASSLLINIKEIFHSDRADATRTNQLFSRGFMASKFNNDGNGCDVKKAICRKMSYMQENDYKNYQDEGFKIRGQVMDANGKPTGVRTGEVGKDGKLSTVSVPDGGGILVQEVVYPDGTTTKSGKEFYAHADTNPNALRRAERAFNSRSAFYLNSFFDSVLAKWKFSKGAAKFPAPDAENDDPNNQKTDENNQDKVFNAEADTVHVDPGTGATDSNNPLRSKGEGVINDVNTRTNDTKGRMAEKGGAVGTLLQGICTVYRLAYLTETAVKAYHTYQLIRFGLLFFQAADQIKDGKGDQDRVTYLSNNVTWYDKNKSKSEGGNLTATDSEGYQIAAHGDTKGLKEFSKRFILGGSVGQKISGFTGAFEKTVDPLPLGGDNGREKMRSACRAIQSPGAIVATACAGLIPAMTAAGSVAPGIGNVIGLATSVAGCACTVEGLIPFIDKIPESILYPIPGIGNCEQIEDNAQMAVDKFLELAQSKTVQDWVFNLLSELHVDDNTRGVDAGNAIAAGAGLMLSVTGTGYGLKPASSKEEVGEYIAFNQDLEQTYAALDKDSAKQNPFDPENQYSIIGSIARSLKSDNYEAAQASPFGLFSTLTGLYSSSLKLATGTDTAEALYNQPSMLGKAGARLDNCKDGTLATIGAIGDTYCSIVGVMSIQELKDARDQAYNPSSQVLDNIIKYMTTDQGDKNEAAGGTFCDRNTFVEGLGTTTSCGDPSKLRSIGDDGTPSPGSQYEMYLKYCTERREAPWGDQYEADIEGSQRDQDWYSGKQCLSDSTMLRNFRMWTNYCLQSGTANGKLNCYTDTEKSKPNSGKGDACSVMNNPNIVFVNPATKEGLKEICETGKATNSCGQEFTINPLLFDVITANSSKYKIWLNNFGFMKDRFSCDGGQHPKGNAIDINGIERLDGSGRAGGPDWGGITYSNPAQVKVIQDYASDWLAALPPERGGVGQKGCSGSFNPKFPANAVNVNGAAFFADSCDHLHIDIRNRTNLNAL